MELTFKNLFSATKQALIERKQTLKDVVFSFLQQVVSLEGMMLTTDQRNELNKIREAANDYDKYFEKTFQEAIDTKVGYPGFIIPKTPKTSEVEQRPAMDELSQLKNQQKMISSPILTR